MIRRHPHVFGDAKAREAGMAKGMWEKIKAEEKAEKRSRDGQEDAGLLDNIPVALPALTRALKLQRAAARVGFDWKEAEPVLDKIEEEIGELRETLAKGDRQAAADEFGDVLFALANLGRHLDLDPEGALRQTNEKFSRRFRFIEQALRSHGRTPEDASLDEMETLWTKAKSRERAAS
jgi:ATP diphosphatase